MSASFVKALGLLQHSPQTVWIAVAVWFAIVFAVFLGPLTAFVGALYEAREKGLLEYGGMAHRHHLEFRKKWMRGPCEEKFLGSADPSSIADLDASVRTVIDMRLFPVDKSTLMSLLLMAGIPLLAVPASQMPLADLFRLIAGVLM